MKKYSRSIFALIFSLYLPTVGCSATDLNVKSPQTDLSTNSVKSSKYSLVGNVSLSDFQSSKFKTKVVDASTIAVRASVSLIYPADYSVVNLRNTAVSAGVTDTLGNFKFNPSDNFTPVVNEVLVLEASKRVGGVGNATISLRTMVRWNGTGWDSISKPNIYINKKTTAIAIIANFSNQVFTSNDTIGRMTVDSNNVSTVNYDTKLTSNGLSRTLNNIDLLMFQNLDPLEYIYSMDAYYLAGPDARTYYSTVMANAHSLQTEAETYAVDNAGIYASNITNLVTEAKSKHYWRETKNPFSGNTGEFIDYDQYATIKNTLFYNGKTLTSISDLKGFIIYKSLPTSILSTSYVIYCLDVTGNFLKDRFGTDFYLSNS